MLPIAYMVRGRPPMACPGAALARGDALPIGRWAHWRGRSNETLLHVAAAYGRADACRRLLLAGVDVTARDAAGRQAHEYTTIPWLRALLVPRRQNQQYIRYVEL